MVSETTHIWYQIEALEAEISHLIPDLGLELKNLNYN